MHVLFLILMTLVVPAKIFSSSEHYLPEDGGGISYRRERLFWDEKGQLAGRSIEEAPGIDDDDASSFDGAYDDIYNYLSEVAACTADIAANLINSLSFSRYLKPITDGVAEEFFGRAFLYLIGFHQDFSETGVHGQGELHDKVRVTLVHGILNFQIDFKRTIDRFSQTHGGVNIHYIFNATEGWSGDLSQAFAAKLGFSHQLAYPLVKTWKELIKEMGGPQGGGVIVHYAHSSGAIHTQSALNLLTEDEKKMIRVITFGSPALIEDRGVESVRNYLSVRDGVCMLDPLRYTMGMLGLKEEIILAGTWRGTPLIDHLLSSKTYQDVIRKLGEEFLETFL
ncbi:MAG: hypothetical protein WB791_07795 [Waddliaceae bacterium]